MSSATAAWQEINQVVSFKVYR